MKISLFALLLSLAFPVSGFASGYVCEDGAGVRVRLYHYNSPKKGTRNPAAFVYSTAAEGTLLVAKGKAIARENTAEGVIYSVAGNEAVDADSLALYVQYKEGVDERAPKTNLPGKLSFLKGEETASIEVSCLRFIKRHP